MLVASVHTVIIVRGGVDMQSRGMQQHKACVAVVAVCVVGGGTLSA